MGKYTEQQLASRIRNIRAVENVMSKFAFLTYYKRYDEAMNKFWSDQDPTLTTNDQKIQGYAAVRRALVEKAEEQTRQDNDVMRKLYPAEFADKKDSEMWGAGSAMVHTITTPVIELAEDEKTAQGMFYSLGSCTEIDRSKGPKAYWVWEKYAVDFILEADGWKIWHMIIMTDFKTPVGENWASVNLAPTGSYYSAYTPETTPQAGAPVPKPYKTFSETVSY
mgnify:CR=1 FL=1